MHADQNKIEHLLDMVFVLFARPVYEQCALFDMRGGREGGSAGEENTPQKVLKGQDGWGGIGVSRGSTRRNIEHRFGCALFEELGREKRINIRGLVRDSCEVSLKSRRTRGRQSGVYICCGIKQLYKMLMLPLQQVTFSPHFSQSSSLTSSHGDHREYRVATIAVDLV